MIKTSKNKNKIGTYFIFLTKITPMVAVFVNDT